MDSSQAFGLAHLWAQSDTIIRSVAVILLVMFIRILRGHFNADKHFGFEAASWYWHFVDVVWVGLFIFVYVL